MEEVVHRLGVVLCVAGLSVWVAYGVEGRLRARALRRRVRAVLEVAAAESRGRRRMRMPAGVRRWGPVAGAGCAGYALVGGVAGVFAGLVLASGVEWWRGRGRGRGAGSAVGSGEALGAEERAEVVRQLPLAAELLAACLAAGADPVGAARAVGESLGGPVGRGLARGAAQVRLGGEAATAWQELAALPGAGGLVRLLERAGESGAPAALPVARFAAECRAERGRRATALARRAAVIITAPVGLCFLPAFLAIGVLPVVIGLTGGVLGGGVGR
ncbi:type II secretion system F family protein [Streptomyces xanthii]|uniref:Type II secretion system F family protein n=2 Tax=Streptomyces xanthii TaxID=2768069 RepID=A0A7H1BJB9_9ACTN|nr:type II secretion system F family protein [Streptomyces xanthii]